MDEEQGISIPTNLMSQIAARLPMAGRISPLWPFQQQEAVAVAPLPANGQGVVGADGELTAGAAAILASMAEVRGFVRIALSSRDRFAETIVYFPVQGAPVLLEPGPNEFAFTVPAPTADMVASLAGQMGISAVRQGDFAAEMSAAEALVLAAVIDWERRHILRELAAGKTPEPLELERGAAAALFAQPEHGSVHWLAPLVAGLTGQEERPAVDAVLASLTGAGFLRSSSAGYLPSEALWNLALHIPLIDRVCAVTAGREVSGAVVVTGFTCVIGGSSNLLYIEAADGRVRLSTPSPREVLAEIEYLLTTPEALQPLVDALPVEPSSGPADHTSPGETVYRTCQACGASLSANDAFCRQCGQPAPQEQANMAPAEVPTAAAAYCRECGGKLKAGMRFCSACGTATNS